jgi:hypothetical protein
VANLTNQEKTARLDEPMDEYIQIIGAGKMNSSGGLSMGAYDYMLLVKED